MVDECRTLRVNEVFRRMSLQAKVLDKIKTGNTTNICSAPGLVASPGIEPGSGASETLILSIVLRGLMIDN